MNSVGVVVVFEAFGPAEVRAAKAVAAGVRAAGASAVAVATGLASDAAVRSICEPLGLAVIAGPPGGGFGAAANCGAEAVTGEVLIVVGAAEPMTTGWIGLLRTALAAVGDGVVGARIAREGVEARECGTYLVGSHLTVRGFVLWSAPETAQRTECDALLSDVLAVSRTAFERVGGFDGGFGADLDAVDLCLRIGESGGRIEVEPAVTFCRLPRVEPRDAERGRARRERGFALRWRERAVPRQNWWPERTGAISRPDFFLDQQIVETWPLPSITAVVHGPAPVDPDAFLAALRAGVLPLREVIWAAAGSAPAGARPATDWFAALAEATEPRGAGYAAFVRTDTVLTDRWLNDLINAIASSPDIVAAAVTGDDAGPAMPGRLDGRCTLVEAHQVPQHVRVRPADSLDRALADWLAAAVDLGRNLVRVRRTGVRVGAPAVDVRAPATVEPSPAICADPYVSIVMLSWNAPEYTEIAVDSIRAHTSLRHEIILIDNGSGPDTLARLRALDGVRIIYNAVNTGFAFGCNQGLAAARGSHVVLLNNDVIVTDGWIEELIDVQRRNPTVGCSGPRSNFIAGWQEVPDVAYRDVAGIAPYAALRLREQRGRWRRVSRIIGMCLCLDRRLIEEIGGLNPRFGTGNFEDDDYCMRIRAAGYDIGVADGSFIHHFGNKTFKANKIDYNTEMLRNRALFSQIWDIEVTTRGYEGRLPWRRGYQPHRDFVALPQPVGVDAGWTRPA